MHKLIIDMVKELSTESSSTYIINSARQHDIKVRLLSVLTQKKKKIPILVGPKGVGKKTLMWEIAKAAYFGDIPKLIVKRNFYLLNLELFYNLVNNLDILDVFERFLSANILIIINMGVILECDYYYGQIDILQFLTSQFCCIVFMNTANDKIFDNISFLSENGIVINIEPPNYKETEEILRQITRKYLQYYGDVKVSEEAIKKTIKLSEKYIGGYPFPEKALHLLNNTAAFTYLHLKNQDDLQRRIMVTDLDEYEAFANREKHRDFFFQKLLKLVSHTNINAFYTQMNFLQKTILERELAHSNVVERKLKVEGYSNSKKFRYIKLTIYNNERILKACLDFNSLIYSWMLLTKIWLTRLLPIILATLFQTEWLIHKVETAKFRIRPRPRSSVATLLELFNAVEFLTVISMEKDSSNNTNNKAGSKLVIRVRLRNSTLLKSTLLKKISRRAAPRLICNKEKFLPQLSREVAGLLNPKVRPVINFYELAEKCYGSVSNRYNLFRCNGYFFSATPIRKWLNKVICLKLKQFVLRQIIREVSLVLNNSRVVSASNIAEIVSELAKIPLTIFTKGSESLLKLEDILHKRVIGQNEAVNVVAKAIRRARTGLKNPNRPIAVFFFAGTTGVGKTELAKALAEQYFGTKEAILRFDMSEY